MKGVYFGNYHSYDDFNLILSSKTIGSPSPKTETIDIPGGDGVLDLTDFFGEVKYNNRELSFEFSTIVPQSEFMALFSMVQNALHGQKMQIILDEDSEWYYTGRISVSEWKAEKSVGKITIDCDCEPYKTRLGDTEIFQMVSGTEEKVILPNGRKTVVPLIDITGNINLTYGENFWALTEGRYELPAVILQNGDNEIIVGGTGTATFTYRERGL
jgi:phage-related protein